MEDLYSLTPAGSVPLQPGPVMAIGLGASSGGPLAGIREHRCPGVKYAEDCVPALQVGNADDPGFLGNIEIGNTVERVCIGRGDVRVRSVGILAELGKLTHGGFGARGSVGGRHDIRHPATGEFHGDERVGVDVGLDGDAFHVDGLGIVRRLGGAAGHDPQTNQECCQSGSRDYRVARFVCAPVFIMFVHGVIAPSSPAEACRCRRAPLPSASRCAP